MSGLLTNGVPVVDAPVTGVATIPAWVSLPGTYTVPTTNLTTVISDGGATPTCDFSDVLVGDYLESGGEIREITSNWIQTGNQRLEIKSAFTVRPSGETPKIVKNKAYTMVSIQNVGAGTAKVDNQDFPASSTPLKFQSDNGLSPIIVDGTSSTLLVTAQV